MWFYTMFEPVLSFPRVPWKVYIPDTTNGTAICTYIDPFSTTPGHFSAVRSGSLMGRVWDWMPPEVANCDFLAVPRSRWPLRPLIVEQEAWPPNSTL